MSQAWPFRLWGILLRMLFGAAGGTPGWAHTPSLLAMDQAVTTNRSRNCREPHTMAWGLSSRCSWHCWLLLTQKDGQQINHSIAPGRISLSLHSSVPFDYTDQRLQESQLFISQRICAQGTGSLRRRLCSTFLSSWTSVQAARAEAARPVVSCSMGDFHHFMPWSCAF